MKHTTTVGKKVKHGLKEKVMRVKKNTGVKFDKSGFFVIHADSRGGKIVVEHYGYDKEVKNKLIGYSAKELCDALVKKGLVSDLDHASYMGRELMKAEMAIRQGLRYKQDMNI